MEQFNTAIPNLKINCHCKSWNADEMMLEIVSMLNISYLQLWSRTPLLVRPSWPSTPSWSTGWPHRPGKRARSRSCGNRPMKKIRLKRSQWICVWYVVVAVVQYVLQLTGLFCLWFCAVGCETYCTTCSALSSSILNMSSAPSPSYTSRIRATSPELNSLKE